MCFSLKKTKKWYQSSIDLRRLRFIHVFQKKLGLVVCERELNTVSFFLHFTGWLVMVSSHFSAISPPIFSGENYAMWSIKMKAYLQAFDLWEVTDSGGDTAPLRANPTVAQMK